MYFTNLKSHLKKALTPTRVAVAFLGLTLGLAAVPAGAGVLAQGFSTKTWVNNGTLPWGANTDHGSEVYNTREVRFISGGCTLREAPYRANGKNYVAGCVYARTQVPRSGYKYVTVDVDIEYPFMGTRGLWPAFWITSAWGWPPEIDIAEFKGNVGRSLWQNAVGSDGVWKTTNYNPFLRQVWHHYGLALGPAGGDRGFSLFMDGGLALRGTIPDAQGVPFWVIANFQTEGDSGAPGPNYPAYFLLANYVLATH